MIHQDLPPDDLTVSIRQAVSQLRYTADLLAHAAELFTEGAAPGADDTDLQDPERILAKLGLRSRTEVAIAVHRVPEQGRGSRNGDA